MSEVLCKDRAFEQIMCTTAAGEEVILVKHNGDLHAYKNSCPHVGIGLDYGDGNCLTEEKDLLCSMHGARFMADSGYCTVGPCAGASLQRVQVGIEEGNIVLYAS